MHNISPRLFLCFAAGAEAGMGNRDRQTGDRNLTGCSSVRCAKGKQFPAEGKSSRKFISLPAQSPVGRTSEAGAGDGICICFSL